MSDTLHTHNGPGAGSRAVRSVHEVITAVSMIVGRGGAARAIADLAALGSDDRVVDIGCGPGTAARHAGHLGATAVGVDPSPAMLRLGRWINGILRSRNVTFAEGSAETLPLSDRSATVTWALSSVHHWCDRAAGLSEIRRVLAPGGRVLLGERLVQPGAHGHAAHGLTRDEADQLALDLQAAGFADVRCDTRNVGRRRLLIVRGARPALG